MRNQRGNLQKQSIKYAVMAVAVANCAGIYFAHERLSKPYAGPSAGTVDAVVDFADAVAIASPAAVTTPAISSPALAYSAREAALTLGIDAGPRPSDLAMSTLPELAPLPPLKVEAAPVIPSVPARAARLGMNEHRAVRFRPTSQQVDRGFESAFTPNYAALAPYDGSTESSGLSDVHPELSASSAAEAPAETFAVDSAVGAGPVDTANSAVAVDGPATDVSAPAPVELPAATPEAVSEIPAG